jgi:hypothetical protein
MTTNTASKVNPFKAIAQRIVNADLNFLEMLQEMHGFSEAEAVKIFTTYRKLRCIKLDAVGGRWTVKHGGFWDRDVCERALAH